MKDEACVHFLQWALPHMHMRWSGFRRVYGQVCKRLAKRIKVLKLDNLEQYQHYLETHKEEWLTLDRLCQVTISRFYRDKMMFAFLEREVLPVLAQQAITQNQDTLKVWSVGCGSGEEPYTLNLAWQFELQQQFPSLAFHIVASDTSADMQQRLEQACYAYATIKNLPAEWREEVFTQQAGQYCLKPGYRGDILFVQQDVRETVPDETFDLILCRNLVFTYYDDNLQRETLERIQQVLKPGGALVLGIHETLPETVSGFESWSDKLHIYRKRASTTW